VFEKEFPLADIVLINPRFEASYWGFEYAMPLLGKRANLPTACLPLLAALTPSEHRITLLDENVAPLDFDRLGRADIVGLTGMSVQRFRMREILRELKARNVFTVVGGPWVTVREDYFGELVDVVFIGEAEDTWPQFLQEWSSRTHASRYEQSQKTDMTQVPCPRYDLIDAKNYLFGSLQISRGCPFQCEFCDIIVTFGRRPRLKTSAQVIRELDGMRQAGMEIAFIVDDNLIGNKQAIKPVLQELVAWQQRLGFPFTFFAEASIDLADDAELMELLVAANIQAVFVGVETPNEDSLRETKKFQNLRNGGSIVEKIRRIQHAGMEVWTGMIVGFDHDTTAIFKAQIDFVQQSNIVHAMCGMLSAIPKTPLYDRLANEQRLDFDDLPVFGTNVIPKQMSREELLDGYRQVMQELNDPVAFFNRADGLYHSVDFRFNKAQTTYWKKHPLKQTAWKVRTLARCFVLFCRLMRQVEDAELRSEYRKRLRSIWRRRRDPAALFVYVLKCAIHYHYYQINAGLRRTDRPLVNSF
jgi:radical SAM superfamily enzyme YgiQ (UPF0313 family)